MKKLIVFDIPSCKAGKKLRMRILRRFAKEEVNRLQDSVWDLSRKANLLVEIVNDFNELRDEIEKESENKPKLFMIEGEVSELL